MAILEKAQLLNTFPWQFITHGKSDLHIIIISNARKTGQKTCSATPSSVNLGIYIQEEQLLLTHKLFRTALTEKSHKQSFQIRLFLQLVHLGKMS